MIKNKECLPRCLAISYKSCIVLFGDISLDDHAVITCDRTISLVSVFLRE